MKPSRYIIPFLLSIAFTSSSMAQEKPKSKNVEIATIQDAINAYFYSIPLQKSNSTWLRYAPSTINGKPIFMLVDSGAHRTFFDVETAKKAKVKIKKTKNSVSGASGSANSYLGTIDSLEIGGIIKLPKGPQYFIDLGEGKNIKIQGQSKKSGGLLGYDILGAGDFNIDLPNNRILIAKSKISGGYWSLLKQSGYQKAQLVASKSAIYIPVRLGKTQGYFQIDTGSSQMIVYSPFVKGKNYTPFKKGGDVLGVGSSKEKAIFITVNDLAIPGHRIETPMLLVKTSGSEVINGQPVMGILGLPVIEQFKMIFNFKKQELYMPTKRSQ